MKSPHQSCPGHRTRAGGFTFVELMMSTAVGLILFGGMLLTLTMQQRAFISALYQVDAQADQSRVQSYFSRDLRGATDVQISADGSQCTVTLPATGAAGVFNSNLGLPLLSLLGLTTSSTNATTVSYYREGTSLVRSVGGVETQLSTSASAFQVSRSGPLVWAAMTFQPSFTVLPALNPLPVNSCVCLLDVPQT